MCTTIIATFRVNLNHRKVSIISEISNVNLRFRAKRLFALDTLLVIRADDNAGTHSNDRQTAAPQPRVPATYEAVREPQEAVGNGEKRRESARASCSSG